MDEIKRQFTILTVFILFILFLLIIYKIMHSNYFNIVKCTPINNEFCLSGDFGKKTNYYQASTLCSKAGMHLPSLDDAWYIWINSENCLRSFSSNELLPLNKDAFVTNCTVPEKCLKSAKYIRNYCSSKSLIKFSKGSQYKYGSFWLKDGKTENHHYGINYSSGRIGEYADNDPSLGVRCIRTIK